jgi:hypothetical protein
VTPAEFVEQAQVTNWPVRILLVLVLVGLIVLAGWGMRRGWQARGRRQAWIPEPQHGPVPSAAWSSPVPGLYLGTAMAGDWLDRVVVHGLGVRSRAELSWSESGVHVDREGAPDLVIPAADIVAVRTDRGVAGTVRGRDSVIVLTWRLGEAVIDTGFRADRSEDHAALLDGLMARYPSPA